MFSYKRLFSDTIIYGVGNAFQLFFQIIALPLISRNIPVEDFGVYVLLFATATTLSTVCIFGMDISAVRFFYDDEKIEHQKKVFSISFYSIIAISALVWLMGFVFAPQVFKLLDLDPAYRLHYIIILSYTPFFSLSRYFQNWLKWTFQRWKYIGMTIGLVLITLGILFYLSRGPHFNLMNIIWAFFFSQVFVTLLGFAWCAKYLGRIVDPQLGKEMIRFAIPNMGSNLVNSIRTNIDRFFLSHYLDDQQFGIYSFGSRIAAFISMVIAAFDIAFSPMVFANWNKEGVKKQIAKTQIFFLLVLIAVCFLVIAFSDQLILLFGSSAYIESKKIIPLLAFGYVLLGLYTFWSVGINYAKKSGINFMVLLIGLAVNYLVNLILTPDYGQYGTAIGWIAGNFVFVYVALWFSQKYYKVPYNHLLNAIIIAVSMTLIVFATKWI